MFGVVEMPALGLNCAPRFSRILFFPFVDNVVVGLGFEETLEDQRKTLRGRFLKCEDADVIIVYAKIPAMTFNLRLGEVVVEECIVLELREVAVCGGEVECSLEDAECFVLIQHADRQKVADLKNKALRFLLKFRLCFAEFTA